MIRMTSSEEKLVKELLLQELPLINYDSENEIHFTNLQEYNEYMSKFKYYPWPTPEPSEMIAKMKSRGLGEYIRDPFYIQEKLKLAKRNDRFKQLPALAVGIDADGKLYFYKKGEGHQNKDVVLTAVFRIPSRTSVDTELDNVYHVYSPLNTVSRNGIYDKNYSLKVVGWLLESAENADKLIDVFKFMIKGMLITHSIVPDYIVTIKSSKPINSTIIKRFKDDEYFSKTKVVEVEKPSTSEVIREYMSGNYPESELFDSLSPDSDIKMRNMGPVDRKIYALISKKLLDDSNKISDIDGKSIIFIDDLITTGNTLSKILIPLYEKGNQLIPFSFLIR